jgi:DNA mismatch repair ATPase MutL
VDDIDDALIVVVEDDGCGIENADAKNILKRGTTSKTGDGTTYGYKGEALYSLSMLSHSVEVLSRAHASPGFSLTFQNGTALLLDYVGGELRGTRVSVKDPLYGLPVRKTDWKRRKLWHGANIVNFVRFCSILHPIRFRVSLSWKKNVDFISKPFENICERVKFAAQAKNCIFLEKVLENTFDCFVALIPCCPNFRFVSLNQRQVNVALGLDDKSLGYFLSISTKDQNVLQFSPKGTFEGISLFMPSIDSIAYWINSSLNNQEVQEKTSFTNLRNNVIQTPIFEEISFVGTVVDKDNLFDIKDLQQLKVVGQFNNGFIIATMERNPDSPKIIVIDQHAADERIYYESLKFKKFGLSCQRLIQPKRLDWDYEKLHFLSTSAGNILDLGFELSFDKDWTYLVSVPSVTGTIFTAEGMASFLY